MNKLAEVNREMMKDKIPEFNVGDTVNVELKIIEGDKEKVQVFKGVVIARKGSGLGETFTVRKISFGEGVERTFYIHSPNVLDIKVVRRGKVRRAKLYYLRKKIGRKAKVKEKRQKSADTPKTTEEDVEMEENRSS